jgi:octaheme c-type cytochrome (tetrathionate reductase family)
MKEPKQIDFLRVMGFLGFFLLFCYFLNVNVFDSYAQQIPVKKNSPPKVDHTKFEILNKKFTEPREVTKACESCHNLTARELMNSNHFNWERPCYIKGRGIVYIGKKNAINNFCIATATNEKSCAKCHVGLGLDAHGKIYTDSTNIDCMVCHDNTGTYMKAQEKGGEPVKTLDFEKIAQSVGKPKRSNCGVCHFYGGGGNNVKHGDLEMAQFEPTKEIDVHMAVDGANLQCSDCHKTVRHNIFGKLYSIASMNRDRVYCEDCHTSTPHKEEIINEHTLKVSCQACHIPVYAKANATKLYWDWSTAGKLKNGEPYTEKDSEGNIVYASIKGSFKWGKNLKPDYIWFNGTASHYLLGDKIKDTSVPLVLNSLYGSYNDEFSKIIPVKIHIAKQPYDPVNKILIVPKLYAENKGEGAFWKDFDWIKASEIGMKEVGLPFSGKVAFIETKMYWPLNHMVSSKENSVKCQECHTRNDSRIANLTDFYIPGRDYSKIVDCGGILLMLFALLGVLSHAGGRIFAYYKLRRKLK